MNTPTLTSGRACYRLNDVQGYLNGRLYENAQDKWFFYPQDVAVIIQIEPLETDEFLLYTALEKDGGGAFLSSFMTLLMIEDINAVTRPEPAPAPERRDQKGMMPVGLVSGSVSMTYFTVQSCLSGEASELAVLLYEFAETVRWYARDILSDEAPVDWNPRIASLTEIRLNHLMEELGEK